MKATDAAMVAVQARGTRGPAGRRDGARLRWVLVCVAAVLAALLPSSLEAQGEPRVTRDGDGWMQESEGSLSPAPIVEISHFVGAVHVIAGAQQGGYLLRLHSAEAEQKDAQKQFADFHLGVGRHGNEALIQPVGPVSMMLRAELFVHLPPGVGAVHVDTLAGKITVHGSVDQLDLQTHGGDIELDNAKLLRAFTMGGSVTVNQHVVNSQIRTGGGDIRVNASLGDLQIASLGGNIYLKAIARGQVQTEGGNIEIIRCNGTLRARTAGGNIRLGEMDGDVAAESGGGNIFVGVAHGAVDVNTAMGNIELWKLYKGAKAHSGMGRITAEFVGDRSSAKNSELVTSMGNIVVYFAGQAPGTLHGVAANCPSRHIISEFPDLKTSSGAPQYGPYSMAVDGPVHGGGPVIDLRTTVGHIELRNAR
jgi:hypothetical protein